MAPVVSVAFAVLAMASPRGIASTPSATWIDQCLALVRSGNYGAAQKVFVAHVPKDRTAAPYCLRLGKAYFKARQWDEARQLLERSLAQEPKDAEAHLYLGLAWRELRDPDRAAKELAESSHIDPRSGVNAYFAGQQFLIMGKPDAALPFLYNAVALNPQSFEALRALGNAQARLANYELAESYYRNALLLKGLGPASESAANLDLAYLLLLGHDPERIAEGLDCARRARRLAPSSADAHYLAGKALVKLGKAREAVLELEAAVRLNPSDSKPHYLLARAFDQLGDHGKAQAERRTLARIEAHRPQAGVAAAEAIAPPP